MIPLTVGKLKELIKDIPNEYVVCIDDNDGAYFVSQIAIANRPYEHFPDAILISDRADDGISQHTLTVKKLYLMGDKKKKMKKKSQNSDADIIFWKS